MKAKTNKNQEKREATIWKGQEKMRAARSSIRAELEETMKYRVEEDLGSLDHSAQGIQVEIQATKILINSTRRGLDAKIAKSQTISSRDSKLLGASSKPG
jgi:hypothetical protein